MEIIYSGSDKDSQERKKGKMEKQWDTVLETKNMTDIVALCKGHLYSAFFELIILP